MKRHVLLYGLLGGVLIAVLRTIEYRFLVVEHSAELYAGLVAIIFSVLGIWLGVTLARSPERPAVVPPETVASTTVALPAFDEAARERAGLTKRELEILALMAAGLSNREIASQIFVSENTVKTHSSRLFEKLGARRRTQAVQLGKQRGLIS